MKREKRFSKQREKKEYPRKIESSQQQNVRLSAAQALNEVLLNKKKLKSVIDEKQKKFVRESDRALLKEIAYGALRRLPFLDFAIENFINKDIKETDPQILSILRVGAYQIFFLDKVPNYAVVNECVNAAKTINMEKAAGFVNTILRRISENKEEIFSLSYAKPFPESLVFKYGAPLWLVKRYIKSFGDEAEEILESFNQPAQNSIVFFSTSDFIASNEKLKDLQIEANGLFDLTFWVKKGNPAENAAFKEGAFYICDPASQLPALALPIEKRSFSLDLCAAPGTKTIVISKRLPKDSFLVSSDFSKGRLIQLIENKEKYSLNNVFLTASDLVNGLCFKEKFYSVLLDAPCSSMGTLKKNPEIRWQIDEERIAKEGKRQFEMLNRASQTVPKGGYLLYSVCSIEKEETVDVVENFLKENKEFSKAEIDIEEKIKKSFTLIDRSTIMVKPNQHRGDSFFVSLFRRKNGRG